MILKPLAILHMHVISYSRALSFESYKFLLKILKFIPLKIKLVICKCTQHRYIIILSVSFNDIRNDIIKNVNSEGLIPCLHDQSIWHMDHEVKDC